MKLRFSIRDLLWLTLLAAIVTAWWIDRSRLAARIDELTAPVQVEFFEGLDAIRIGGRGLTEQDREKRIDEVKEALKSLLTEEK
jgi:hypothetical protein